MANIELKGILEDGYGLNPKKLWKLKIGEYILKNGKKIKGIYIKSIMSYMLSYTGGGKLECFPSIKTISEDLYISRDLVINAINALCELNFINKSKLYPDDKLKTNNKYTLIILNDCLGSQNDGFRESIQSNQGIDSFDTNNNNINNNIINKSKHTKISKKEEVIKEKKDVYNDNVYLTNKEYNKLLELYGLEQLTKIIEKLSSYKLAHGKKYKSDYGAINQWVVGAVSAVRRQNFVHSGKWKCPKCGVERPQQFGHIHLECGYDEDKPETW